MKKVLACVACLGVILSGCGRDTPPRKGGRSRAKKKSATLAGSATPRACFNKASAAVRKKDWKAFLETVDPGERPLLVMSVHLVAGFTAAFKGEGAVKELEAIGKRHDLRDIDDSDPELLSDHEKARAYARKAYGGVKDLPRLFDDLMSFALEQGATLEFKRPLEVKLKDVKAGDETARGVAVDPGGKTWKIEFVKRKGGWYIKPPIEGK